jgi:hypothetical protein
LWRPDHLSHAGAGGLLEAALPEGFLEGSRCRHHGDLHGAESGDTTVRRYINAATAEELLTQVARRGRALDAHLDYLAQRWQEGCTNAAWLAQELRARGCRGAERSVRRLLQTWRTGLTSPSAAPPAAQTPRDVTGWIIRPTAKRTEQEQANLTRILDRRPTLRTLGLLVGDFGMLCKRRGSISTPGSRTRGPAISRSRYAAVCSRTTTPSETDSPFSGAAAQLRALSADSRRSRGRCSAEPSSTFYASASCAAGRTSASSLATLAGHHYHLRPSAHRRHRNPPPPRADVPRAPTSSRPQRKRLGKPSTAGPTAMSSASAPASVQPRRPRSP